MFGCGSRLILTRLFFQTAKQEDLIDLLRKSYLDVRLMDKQKADQIGRLQNVINAQKLSLDKCQVVITATC